MINKIDLKLSKSYLIQDRQKITKLDLRAQQINSALQDRHIR